MKKLHSGEETPSVACFGSWALRVATAGIRELPASPTPLVCFLLKPGPRLSRGLNFPPVVLTQIGAAGVPGTAGRH